MSTWNERYEPVIGLEVHAQLLTRSKAFCKCSTQFGNAPNSNVCPICMGMPGTLPVLNKEVVEFAIRMGLATNCKIAPKSILARKNYFYPDLPKGYQISQFEEPLCSNGYVDIELDDGAYKRIRIRRIHIEEDAGKSIHDVDADTLLDFNRCGVPLIEIVSEPDLRSPREAYHYVAMMRQIVTYLGICDGNMEEGSLRCDANVSVRPKGAQELGTKTEVKNMNSFRFVEKALDYEINRQISLIEDGTGVKQETLLWDANQGICLPMRTKEESHDYRYFPDPDLVPIIVNEQWIAEVRTLLPEFPTERRNRFVSEYQIPKYDADILTSEKDIADYFESVITGLKKKGAETYKMVSNWTMTDILRIANERHIGLKEAPVSPPQISELINLIVEGAISGKIAKEVFEEMLSNGKMPKEIVEEKGLLQVSDHSMIEKTIDEVLEKNRGQVESFLTGKKQVFGFFVGETMKLMRGKANPKIVNEILTNKLEKLKQ